MEKTEDRFTVGELAARVGVTVRTLQYYDKTGLLKASLTEGGRRVYTRRDILKLQILFLKSFGFPLQEIRNRLMRRQPASGLSQVFSEQREILLGQIDNLKQIVHTLDQVINELQGGGKISLEKLMMIMKLMKEGNPYAFVVRYFGAEQLQRVARRFSSPELSQQFMQGAQELFAELNKLYHQGADPEGEAGQRLAARWWALVDEFTAGDSRLLEPLLNAGRDIDNWPQEARSIQEAITRFLKPALDRYFHQYQIKIPELGEGTDD